MSKKATITILISSPYQAARDDDTGSPDKPDDNPELLDDYSRAVPGVVVRVGPAVVGIRLKMKDAAHRGALPRAA
ncbi:MAG: hypothetical protein JW765_00755 [Deltaproteobacteria bacterium]|nr:hypothetical protein [Candidatus Zymogenaceae bacterium]